jgi:sec-independent protein translocase protein TatC
MSTSRASQPDSDDFFADTRMSFGDHIEDLRRHLIRAIAGFAVAVCISFFYGHLALEFITAPIERELEVYYKKRLDKATQDYIDRLDVEQKGTVEVWRPVRRDYMEALLGHPVGKGARLSADGQYVLFPLVVDSKQEAKDFAGKLNDIGPRPTLKSFTVMETVVVWLKVCLICGLVLGSPWIFYQIWSFIAAGLYPQEKRLVNHYLPFSILLFLAGVLLCQFVVMPKTIAGLLMFNEWLGIDPELRLNDWLTFALLLPILFGVCFQTPLAMLTLERIGLATVDSYRKKRLIFLFVMMVVFAVLSPTPDPFFTPAVFFLSMWGLYELGIWLCKLAPRRPSFAPDEAESEEMVEV